MSTSHRMTRRDTEPAVGRDIEAWCGSAKCNRLQEHTIMAMVGLQIVQVRCKICGGTHKFKSAREAVEATSRPRATSASSSEAAAPRPKSPKPAASGGTAAGPSKAQVAAANAAQVLWQRAMRERKTYNPLPYAPTLQPKPGDVIQHPSFGLGLVEGLLDGKAKILFATGVRLLVVGRDLAL